MPERQRDFLSDLFQAVAERSRKLLRLQDSGALQLSAQALAEALLSTRGEASGVALSRALLDRWHTMTAEERSDWFQFLARDLGPDPDALNRAVAQWTEAPSPAHASRLHQAAEPRRQELFRRMNLAPGGTATLVKMREALAWRAEGEAGVRRRRCRSGASLHLLVQPWLPRPEADRVVEPRRRAREDHPL